MDLTLGVGEAGDRFAAGLLVAAAVIGARDAPAAVIVDRSNGVAQRCGLSHAATRAGARPTLMLEPSTQPRTPSSRVWKVSMR